MTKTTIHAAKTNLSKLIAKVEAGEEVIICRGDKEVAKLVNVKGDRSRTRLRGGAPKPKMVIADAFYDPWSPKDFGPGVMDAEPDWGEPGTWDGRTPRKPGALKGVITLDESFFDPLSSEDLGLVDDPRDAK